MATKIPEIGISKIEAAKRQLETAITLYFQNADPVSIHTLVAAAHEILHGICKVRGLESLLKDVVKQSIRKEKQNEYNDIIREAENFFKHGRRDPDASFEFRPVTTEIFIFDACFMYESLTMKTPKPLFIFKFWFLIKNPYMIAEEYRDEICGGINRAFSTHNRSAFYQETSYAYDEGFFATRAGGEVQP